jgi:hypothetical protein
MINPLTRSFNTAVDTVAELKVDRLPAAASSATHAQV